MQLENGNLILDTIDYDHIQGRIDEENITLQEAVERVYRRYKKYLVIPRGSNNSRMKLKILIENIVKLEALYTISQFAEIKPVIKQYSADDLIHSVKNELRFAPRFDVEDMLNNKRDFIA